MNIQSKKSEAAADPVMGGIAEAKKFVDKNGTSVIVVCAAALIIAGVVLFYNNIRESNIRKSQELFGVGILDYNAEQFDVALESFTLVVSAYKGTPAAQMSAFMMGSIYLARGEVDQAIVWFGAAANGTRAGFVRAQAFEGLAAAHETKGDAAAAVRYLERALREDSGAHRRAAIRWKLALLNKDNAAAASAFCDQIIADTLAMAYHQRAENLLAALNVK